MAKTSIVNNMTRGLHKVGFTLKKHSPQILVAVGVAGTVTSAVLACRATTKLDSVLSEGKEKVEKINGYIEENGFTEEYSEDDYKKDLAITHVQTGVELVKLYAPAVGLGVLSLAAIVSSHKILTKRNVALAAAYATEHNAFKEYRGRLVDRFGKELDRELKYNIKAKEIEETVVNEDGSEQTITKTVNAAHINQESDYARFFDEYCAGWTKDPEYNLTFLKLQQNHANDILRTRGYLYLNEVYEMLGIPKTKAGHVVGWIYDEENPVGDNFVDFGIYDVRDANKRQFVNGLERSILLDFNVDGNVWEMMK